MKQLPFRTKPPQMSTQQDKLSQSSNPKPSAFSKPYMPRGPLTFSGKPKPPTKRCFANGCGFGLPKKEIVVPKLK